jgi:hypothetical protein
MRREEMGSGGGSPRALFCLPSGLPLSGQDGAQATVVANGSDIYNLYGATIVTTGASLVP